MVVFSYTNLYYHIFLNNSIAKLIFFEIFYYFISESDDFMEKFDFFNLKTDLADENDEILRNKNQSVNGIVTQNSKRRGVDIFEMHITSPHGEKISGRKPGRYCTVTVGKTHFYDSGLFENVCLVLSEIFESFIKARDNILLAGLGNPAICADSVGTQTAQNFIVTRHIKEAEKEIFDKFFSSETSAITPNVLGNTGIEAAHIIKGIADDIKPSCIIAVDALASRRLSRLATTVQICDTGIFPGSGVGNVRAEISEETMGCPVIAVGVPTVVNASTLICDILSECGIGQKDIDDNTMKSLYDQVGQDCFVSPKSCETDIRSISKLIGYAINHALHKNIDLSSMHDFL